jgi:hypothetical protein
MSGVELITAERQRQVTQEGWTSEHDDEHRDGELCLAALCYAQSALYGKHLLGRRALWPWGEVAWKPKSPVEDLVRAGALIAAEIDRLQRLKPK